jgi:regulator of RNase E activity RraA
MTGSRVKANDAQIDGLPEDCVVFISCPRDVTNAVFGGLMATRARASGAAGTIIDGRFRDLQEQRDLKYPVSFKYRSWCLNSRIDGLCRYSLVTLVLQHLTEQ